MERSEDIYRVLTQISVQLNDIIGLLSESNEMGKSMSSAVRFGMEDISKIRAGVKVDNTTSQYGYHRLPKPCGK